MVFTNIKKMGTGIFDQFSLLHAAVGVIFYFFSISLPNLLIIHTIFEFVENSPIGIYTINKYIPFWPGGKHHRDSVINIVGDTISVTVGWLLARCVDDIGKKYKLYY